MSPVACVARFIANAKILIYMFDYAAKNSRAALEFLNKSLKKKY